MAEIVNDVVVRYLADVSDLTAKVERIESSMRSAAGAGAQIGTSLRNQTGIIENLRRRLEQLTIARDKSNDPAKIARFNDILRVQGARLDELTGKTKNAANALTPMGAVFDSLGAAVAGAFAVDQVIRFASASVDAFAVAQKAQLQLLNALNGQQDVQQRLLRQATQIQDTLGIDDDVIVRQQAFLALQGRSEEVITKTIRAAIQLSEVTGEDLASSVQKLDATIEGNIGRLGKLDSRFKDLSKTQLANGAAIDLINEKYAGFAEAGAASVAGQLEIQKRRAEELTEEIGENLAPAFIKAKLAATEFFASALRGFNQIASRGQFKKEQALKEAQEEITKEIEVQTAALKTGEVRSQLANERNKEITIEAALNKARQENNVKEFNFQKQELALQQARVKAYQDVLKAKVAATDESEKKEIESLETLNAKKAELEQEQSQLQDPLGVNRTRANELIKLIEETQKKIDDITGKTAADAAKKQQDADNKILESRRQASERLAELDRKINETLIAGSNLTALERLEIERNRAEEELKITFDASQKTLKDKANLNNGLLNLTEEFARREREIKTKAALEKSQAEEDTISTELDQAKARFDLLQANIDSQQAIKLAEIDSAFVQAGDNSEEAVRQNQEDIANIESTFQSQRIDAQKKFVDDFVALNEKLFKSKRDTADIEIQREVTTLFSNVNPVTGLPTPAQMTEASERIKAIQKGLRDEQIKLGNEVTQALLDGQDAVTDGAQANADRQRKILEDFTARQKELASEIKAVQQEIIDTAINGAFDVITNSTNRQFDAELEATRETLDAKLTAIDAEREANDRDREAGIIGEREAQQNRETLLQRQTAAEELAAKKEQSLKRKQFQADQRAAISKVVIANLINAAEFPALAAYYGGLALVQSGLILAEPNPYKKGTKKSKAGLSLVGEEGPELMMMGEGNKIISNGKTKKNASLIDAMFDDTVDEYIQYNYVNPTVRVRERDHRDELNAVLQSLQISPALKVAEQKYEIYKQQQFAMNIANSFIQNKEILGMTRKDYYEVSNDNIRKGVTIKNIDKVVEPIIGAILQNQQPSFQR